FARRSSGSPEAHSFPRGSKGQLRRASHSRCPTSVGTGHHSGTREERGPESLGSWVPSIHENHQRTRRREIPGNLARERGGCVCFGVCRGCDSLKHTSQPTVS